MTSPLNRIRQGALGLAAVFLCAVIGFHSVAGYDWLDAIWMVVVTISTVGYSEHSDASPPTKILVIVVILLGVTAAAYTFTGIIQMVLQGEIDSVLGRRRMEREISKLKRHTIICGFGKTGPVLAQQLAERGQSFVIIERDEDQHGEAIELGYLAIHDDATDEDVLKESGIGEARAIVVALPSDAENVFITLSARNLCPQIRIVAQAERESSSRKLRQAGADEVVMAHQMVAQHMSRLVTRPSTAKFFAMLAESQRLDLELDELLIPETSRLVGRSIAELRIRDQHHLLVVGIKPHDGELDFNPDGQRKFNAHETVLLMGKPDDIDLFRIQGGLRTAP
ncbi:MAG: potassium channel protein [Planctomycetota bacterium]